MSARLACLALATLAALGCDVDVDLHGPVRLPAPSVAALGAPSTLAGAAREATWSRLVASGNRGLALRGTQAWLFSEDGTPATAPFEANTAVAAPGGFAVEQADRMALIRATDGAVFPLEGLYRTRIEAGSPSALLALWSAETTGYGPSASLLMRFVPGSPAARPGTVESSGGWPASSYRHAAAGSDFAGLSTTGLRVLLSEPFGERTWELPGAIGPSPALACDATACLVVHVGASWIVQLATGAVTTVPVSAYCHRTDSGPSCDPVGATALGDGRFLAVTSTHLTRLGRAGVEAQTPLAWVAPGEAVATALIESTAFVARGAEAFMIRDARTAGSLVLEPWTTLPPPPRASVTVPANVASACAGDVCLVPALGLVSRRDGTQVGGPQLDVPFASDGRDFYVADGYALKRLAPDGTLTTVGEEQCTHVAWTGAALIAVCRDTVVRLEGDRLVPTGNRPFAPFASEGISMVALVGTGAGALAVGHREPGAIWAAPLDAQGLVAGFARLVAISASAPDARALGSGDHVLVAWPEPGDASGPSAVTHIAVIDAAADVVAAPHAPLPGADAAMIASDGTGWLFAWTEPSDGSVRAVRFDRDGVRVTDVASDAGINLGFFPLESAVGLESGPYLLFGAGRQRTLRFVPATD